MSPFSIDCPKYLFKCFFFKYSLRVFEYAYIQIPENAYASKSIQMDTAVIKITAKYQDSHQTLDSIQILNHVRTSFDYLVASPD